MPAFNDLTGKKFGNITVLRRVEDHITKGGSRITRYECKCDLCESIFTKYRGELTSGDATSCPKCALSKPKFNRRKVEPGDKFGRLTVIKDPNNAIGRKGNGII